MDQKVSTLEATIQGVTRNRDVATEKNAEIALLNSNIVNATRTPLKMIMIRSDHPSDTKRGVFIYYKEHLTFLDECLVGEIKIGKSKCFETCAYRSPNQTADELTVFSFWIRTDLF